MIRKYQNHTPKINPWQREGGVTEHLQYQGNQT